MFLPGFTPLGCAGGFESALKPAVVWNAGLRLFPPGRSGGEAPCAMSTPALFTMLAMPSSVPSSK